MRRFRTAAAGLAAVFTLVAGSTAIVAAVDQSNPQVGAGQATATATPVCKRQSAANSAGQDIFLSTPDSNTYAGLAWQNVSCTNTTFSLKFGERALVVADFNAEADCDGNSPANGQWCQTRALLNGIEGSPVAAEPSSFAFDSVAGGSHNWQAHEMNRAWEVRCGSDKGCSYSFVVQTKMHDSTVTSLWLDEVTAHLRITSGAPAPL